MEALYCYINLYVQDAKSTLKKKQKVTNAAFFKKKFDCLNIFLIFAR